MAKFHAQVLCSHDGWLGVVYWRDRPHRAAVYELARIWVLGRREQPFSWRDFNEDAMLHHCDALCELAHEIQVMRDQKYSQTIATLQVQQQIDDSRADRDIERGRWLVGDQ
jgi:hypothetical protein